MRDKLQRRDEGRTREAEVGEERGENKEGEYGDEIKLRRKGGRGR